MRNTESGVERGIKVTKREREKEKRGERETET